MPAGDGSGHIRYGGDELSPSKTSAWTFASSFEIAGKPGRLEGTLRFTNCRPAPKHPRHSTFENADALGTHHWVFLPLKSWLQGIGPFGNHERTAFSRNCNCLHRARRPANGDCLWYFCCGQKKANGFLARRQVASSSFHETYKLPR